MREVIVLRQVEEVTASDVETVCHECTLAATLGIVKSMVKDEAKSERTLKLAILAMGLVLRFVWMFFRGLSRDDLTSISYVTTPGWTSAGWDNAPSTFYLVMKVIFMIGESEWLLRSAAFAVSAVSFVVFFRFLDREEKGNPWLLAFWAVFPTSVVNATFRPTVFVELAGILFFFATRSRSLLKIGAGFVALMATTYLAAVAPLVALADEDFRDRKKLAVFGVGLVAAVTGIARIRWQSLTWIETNDWIELGRSSLLMLSQLWGFSLPLFVAILWTLWRGKKIPRSVLAIVFLIAIGPFITGHKFASSRFLISLTPWVVTSVALALRLRREIAVGAIVVLIPSVTTTWFLIHEKSGWNEAGRYVAATGEKAIIYAPITMAWYFSPKFTSAEPDMEAAIAKSIADGGWIIRANPGRDARMKNFLSEVGHHGFEITEKRIFGENSLEPVQAVRIVPKN